MPYLLGMFMWNCIWAFVLGGALMYIFSSIVADKVADKVIKEIGDLIDDKME